MQNLLASTTTSTDTILSETTSFSPRSHRRISGLDIGTGASCIYPLLYIASTNNQGHKLIEKEDIIKTVDSGTATSPGTTQSVNRVDIIATDTDHYSLGWAERNVTLNSALMLSSGSNVRTILTSPSDQLLLPLINSIRSQNEVLGLEPGSSADIELEVEPLDFTMCNPPFYSSMEEMQQSYADKGQAPAAICTGSASEMVYQGSSLSLTDGQMPTGKDNLASKTEKQKQYRTSDGDGSPIHGGDAAFALRILAESSAPSVRHLVRWYSCMMGKLSSLKTVVDQIKALGVNNWAVCQLNAGKRTRRWAVAWSWGGARPSSVCETIIIYDIRLSNSLMVDNKLVCRSSRDELSATSSCAD